METKDLPGLIATICISGSVDPHFAANLSNMRSWNDRNGFHKVEYKIIEARLVEKGRNEACEHALRENYAWLLQIDADAAPFPPDALARMLHTAFVRLPALSALGAYCQLKGWPGISTIDTGTGTWEIHYPGKGVLGVIRTGAHFLLTKVEALRSFGPPWFQTREVPRPAKSFMEVDNFARTHLDGTNPLTSVPEWDTLVAEAKKVSSTSGGNVGEDSGFCDALRAAGGEIAVDTDLVVGHVATEIILPGKLKENIDKMHREERRVFGVLE